MSALSLAGRRVNLPKLEMKKVSGKISEWQEFWDGFKSAIYDDVQLANVDKFEYLQELFRRTGEKCGHWISSNEEKLRHNDRTFQETICLARSD